MRPAPPRPADTRVSPGQVFGEILLTLGVLLLLFAFYESYWANLHSRGLQKHAQDVLEQQ